jgi:hypothetical protein
MDDIIDRLTTLFWAMKDAGRVQDKNLVADAIAEIERLQQEANPCNRRPTVADDIVTRLRADGVYGPTDKTLPLSREAADEIERLRAALQIAAGKLSTLPPFTNWHPEVIYKALLEDGAEEVNRG